MSKTREAKLVALEVEDRYPFSKADEFETVERDRGIDAADLPVQHPDRDGLLEFWSSGFWHSFARYSRRRGANFRARPFSRSRARRSVHFFLNRARHRRRP